MASLTLCMLGDLMRCARDLHAQQHAGAAAAPRTGRQGGLGRVGRMGDVRGRHRRCNLRHTARLGASAVAGTPTAACLPAHLPARRELEAMAAAHWQAVQALDAAGAVAALRMREAWDKLAESLGVCMAAGPPALAADEGLHRLYERAREHGTAQVRGPGLAERRSLSPECVCDGFWHRRMMQLLLACPLLLTFVKRATPRDARQDAGSPNRHQLVSFAPRAPRLAAFLLTSGRLAASVRQARRDVASGSMQEEAVSDAFCRPFCQVRGGRFVPLRLACEPRTRPPLDPSTRAPTHPFPCRPGASAPRCSQRRTRC